MNWSLLRLTLVAVSLMAVSIAPASGEEERQVMRPQDSGQALPNPDMGWNFPYFTDNGDRAIAEERHRFMEDYLRRFYEEWEGG